MEATPSSGVIRSARKPEAKFKRSSLKRDKQVILIFRVNDTSSTHADILPFKAENFHLFLFLSLSQKHTWLFSMKQSRHTIKATKANL